MMVLRQVQTKFVLIQLIAQNTNQKSKRFPYRRGHVGNCHIFLFVIGVFVVFLRYEKKGSSIPICKRKSFPYIRSNYRFFFHRRIQLQKVFGCFSLYQGALSKLQSSPL